jgi:Na+-driven multidrug efflux pump
MIIGFFMGLAAGASVVISQYYGARDDEKVREAVHTTMVMTFILVRGFYAYRGADGARHAALYVDARRRV